MLKKSIDKNGNEVSLLYNGVCELKLVMENKTRVLGKIENRILKIYKPNSHIHYKTNSIGFNAELIDNDFGYDFIELEFRGNKYLFEKKIIVINGFYMQFKNTQYGNSYELQKFLSMDIIQNYKQ